MSDETPIPERLLGWRSMVDGQEMTGDDIVRVYDNIKNHAEDHTGFPLGSLDRRVSVATAQLRKAGVIKMGRKGWELVK